MLITKHACQRAKERLGLNKKAIKRMAEIAFEKGLRHSDTNPHSQLNRFFSALYLKHEFADNIRIYGEHVYIFGGEKLVTIFKLPGPYRKMVKKI